MTKLGTSDPVPVGPVHAGSSTPCGPPLAVGGRRALLGAVHRLHRTFRPNVGGPENPDRGRVGDARTSWRPAAGHAAGHAAVCDG